MLSNQKVNQFRKTPRAVFLCYDEGVFFVTICTKDKKHYFGEISDGKMCLSSIGIYVDQVLQTVDRFCDYIEVPLYVVMPNHIHLVASIYKTLSYEEIETGIIQRAPNPALRANPTCQRHVPTLSKFINSFKGAVTKYAKSLNIDFAWQGRYHDHFIRGDKDGNRIWEYIVNNVAKWQDDCFNPNNLTNS